MTKTGSALLKKPNLDASTTPSATESIEKLAKILLTQHDIYVKTERYAQVKEVLALLGTGAVLAAAIIAPGSIRTLKPLYKSTPDWDQWKHFNEAYLRRTLQRLESQKDIEIVTEGDQKVLRLTNNGQRKILKYSLDNLKIEKPKQWDGRWRLVIYDVPVRDKLLGDVIRQALRMLGFYAIQDSVYIYPYSCFDQIEFLRQYYSLGDKVQYMLVQQIENDEPYKIYFNLV